MSNCIVIATNFLTVLALLFVEVPGSLGQSLALNDTTITNTTLSFTRLEVQGKVTVDSTSVFAPAENSKIIFHKGGKLTIQGEVLNSTLQGLEVTSNSTDCTGCQLNFIAKDSNQKLKIDRLFAHDIFQNYPDTTLGAESFLQFKKFKSIEFVNSVVDSVRIRLHQPLTGSFDIYGAIYIDSCQTFKADRCTFIDNRSSNRGGAISLFNTDSITIQNSDFIGNIGVDTTFLEDFSVIAGQGSAIFTMFVKYISVDRTFFANELGTTGVLYSTAPELRVSNSIFANNQNSGLMVLNFGTIRSIDHCSFLNNTSRAVHLGTDSMKISNSISLNNRGSRGLFPPADLDVSALSPSANFIYTRFLFLKECRGCPPEFSPDTSNLFVTPIKLRFDYSLRVNPEDFTPSPESWLIDKGNISDYREGDVDFFGNPRWVGDAPDIGAIEYQVVSTGPEPDDLLKIAAFPNPMQNQLQVTSTKPIAELKLYTLHGQLVYSDKSASQKQKTLDVSQLPIGSYYLVVTDVDTQTKTIKLLKMQ